MSPGQCSLETLLSGGLLVEVRVAAECVPSPWALAGLHCAAGNFGFSIKTEMSFEFPENRSQAGVPCP